MALFPLQLLLLLLLLLLNPLLLNLLLLSFLLSPQRRVCRGQPSEGHRRRGGRPRARFLLNN